MRKKRAYLTLGALLLSIVAASLLAGVTTSTSEARDAAFPSLRPGQPVAVDRVASPQVERANLLGTADGQALYRVSVRGQGVCFGAGPADRVGSVGEFACGYDDFPTPDKPVIYGAVVGADGPGRVLGDADWRLYRLNVIAADGITAIEVAGKTIAVRNNIASISFEEGAALGVVTSVNATGEVVDAYDLRPQQN